MLKYYRQQHRRFNQLLVFLLQPLTKGVLYQAWYRANMFLYQVTAKCKICASFYTTSTYHNLGKNNLQKWR